MSQKSPGILRWETYLSKVKGIRLRFAELQTDDRED